MSEGEEREPLWANVDEIDIGVPGVVLKHFPGEYMLANGLPVDGYWSPTWTANDMRMSRACFRTLHAAAHYVLRLLAIPGALEGIASVVAAGDDGKLSPELAKAMYHAEAHAHDCDAVYPPGNIVEMENGPSIVDDTGDTRKFMSQAPAVYTEKNADGETVCKECGEPLSLRYEASR